MGIIIAETESSFEKSVSIDTQVYVGQNGIRRNVGRTTSLYVGDSVNRAVSIKPGTSFLIDERPSNLGIATLFIATSGVLLANVTYSPEIIVGTQEIRINKLLVLDGGDLQKILRVNLVNDGADIVNVQIVYTTYYIASAPTQV